MTKRLLAAGGTALLLAAPGLSREPAVGAVRSLSPAEAARLLRGPVDADPAASRVLARVTAAYRGLGSLETTSQDGQVASVVRLKRPRLYHNLQRTRTGMLLGVAVSDGARYYEYTESRKSYVERQASLLDRLMLPPHARLFFAAQEPGTVMTDLDGKPAVREYRFRYSGRQRIRGVAADTLRISTMTRVAGGGWNSFESTRSYDAKSSLLIRAVNGRRTVDVMNRPNPPLPTERFRWRPIPGATKALR